MTRYSRAPKRESTVTDGQRRTIEEAIDVWRWIAESRSRFEQWIARYERQAEHGLPDLPGKTDEELSWWRERSKQDAQEALRSLRARLADFERRVLPYARRGSRRGVPFALIDEYRQETPLGPPGLRDVADRDQRIRRAYHAVVGVLQGAPIDFGSINGAPIVVRAGETRHYAHAEAALDLAWDYDQGPMASTGTLPGERLRALIEAAKADLPDQRETELAVQILVRATDHAESTVRKAVTNRTLKKRAPKRASKKSPKTR